MKQFPSSIKRYNTHGDGSFIESDYKSIEKNIIFERDVLVFHPEHIIWGDNIPNVKLYYQDVGHYEKMKNVMKLEGIDVVFNLAVVLLLTSHELHKITCEDNINITLAMLELAKDDYFKTLIH